MFSTPTSSFYQPSKVSNLQQLKIVTWNVWFEEFEQRLRYDEILNICNMQQPDVICFQEVTTSFLDQLRHWDILRYYNVSDDFTGASIGHYGVLTLVKKDYLPEFAFYSFPTGMGRRFLVTKVSLPSSTPSASPFDPSNRQNIYVGNVHLESLEYHHIREQQLAICSEILSQFPYYFLCGDFNFCSYRNRPFALTNTDQGMMICPSPKHAELHNNSLFRIFPMIKDLWEQMKPLEEPGYTLDGSYNELLDNRNEKMRYDRICFHFNNNRNHNSTDVPPSSTQTTSEDSDSMPVSPNENINNTNIGHPSEAVEMLMRSSESFDEMTGKVNDTADNSSNDCCNKTSQTKIFQIEPKSIQILGNEPIMQRRLSDPPPMMTSAAVQSVFVSPAPVDRPYRSIYNRKLIYVFPSDHFGLCGTFQFQF
jgi:exonuclease III